MRLVKDAWEVERAPGRDRLPPSSASRTPSASGTTSSQHGERWLEGTFWRRARAKGNDVGYESHRRRRPARDHPALDRERRPDRRRASSILLDMGVENRSLYTADVTRTLPIDGTFTDEQRHLYDLVFAAQEAGMAAVQPGARYKRLPPGRDDACSPTGSATWASCPCSAEEALDKDSGVYRRWTLHGTGHMLGLDVHDCSAARARELPRRQARARHGAHRRAGALLPDQRPARARVAARRRHPDRGRRRRHRRRLSQPVRRACRGPRPTSRRGWPALSVLHATRRISRGSCHEHGPSSRR